MKLRTCVSPDLTALAADLGGGIGVNESSAKKTKENSREHVQVDKQKELSQCCPSPRGQVPNCVTFVTSVSEDPRAPEPEGLTVQETLANKD